MHILVTFVKYIYQIWRVLQKMPDSLTYDICYLDRNAGIILSQQETVQLLDTINLLQGPQFAVTDGYFDDVYNATVNILDKVLTAFIQKPIYFLKNSFLTVQLFYALKYQGIMTYHR